MWERWKERITGGEKFEKRDFSIGYCEEESGGMSAGEYLLSSLIVTLTKTGL